MRSHIKFSKYAAIRLVALLLLCVLPFTPMVNSGNAQGASEYQVKAAFLLNFAKFIEWPSGHGETVIGIVGDDPFGTALDQMAISSHVNGFRFRVRRLKWNDNLRDCQILFISLSERTHQYQIIQSVKDAGVLTVGESSQFNELGGIIRFFLTGNKVHFQINVAAAEHARLRVSSKLLALSKGKA